MTDPTKKRLIQLLKALILVAVVAGIARTIVQAMDQFREQEFRLADVHFGWVAASGFFYLVGMIPAWYFWHRTLRAMGQHPTLWESFRAYYISHLGKYVPGKAMVVVLRAAAVRGDRCDTTVAATSVFVETLTLMAVGACLSAIVISVQLTSGSIEVDPRERYLLIAIAVGLMLCAGIPTIPPIFRKVVMMLPLKRLTGNLNRALEGLDFRLMALGWMILLFTWLSFGLSLWAIMQSIPDTPSPLNDLPLLTACIALSTVAGFVSMLPGGLGVRELVIMTMIKPKYGEVAAIVSAVLLRLAWLVAEVVVLIMLNLSGRARASRADMDS